MNKTILNIFLVLALGITKAQTNAIIEIPIQVADSMGNQKELIIGLDKDATDSIDAGLGESEIPPSPPPPSFDAATIIPTGQRTFKDIRKSETDLFTGTIEYKFQIQADSLKDSVFLSWNMPDFCTGILQDNFNGSYHNYSFGSGPDKYTVDKSQTFSIIKLIITYTNAPLPVELKLFTGSLSFNRVKLKWETISETNNYGFEIERKDKFNFWEKIGFVKGNGNSNIPHNYEFLDSNIKRGLTYDYRLKQIDFDGKFEYSKTISIKVDVEKEMSLRQNYPNPFNPVTIISFSFKKPTYATLEIFNVNGEKVWDTRKKLYSVGLHKIRFNSKKVGTLASGIYYYSLKTNRSVEIKRMLLLK